MAELADRSELGVITTPAGSTIEPGQDGGYRICDRGRHCRGADSLWEAQMLVQWAEVHHQNLASVAVHFDERFSLRTN